MENQTKVSAPESAKVVAEASEKENPKAILWRNRDLFVEAEITVDDEIRELLKKQYGSRRNLAVDINNAYPNVHWWNKKHATMTPANNPVIRKEIEALRKSIVDPLDEAGHSNGGQAWKKIRDYGEEESSLEGTKSKSDKGNGANSNDPRDPKDRIEDVIYQLYHGIHNHKIEDSVATDLVDGFAEALKDAKYRDITSSDFVPSSKRK